jgi:hypothetical protein
VLYRLSYLALDERSVAPLSLDTCAGGGEPVDEDVHELVLHEDRVGAGFRDRLVESGMSVSRKRDHAHARMVAPEPGDRGHTVQPRHVQVDHDGIRRKLLCELDRRQPILSRPDDGKLRLALDQGRQGVEEQFLVVREQHPNHMCGLRLRHRP